MTCERVLADAEFRAKIQIVEPREQSYSDKLSGVLEYSNGFFTAYHYLNRRKVQKRAFKTTDIALIEPRLTTSSSYMITLKGSQTQSGTQIGLYELEFASKRRLHQLLSGENPHNRHSLTTSQYSATKVIFSSRFNPPKQVREIYNGCVIRPHVSSQPPAKNIISSTKDQVQRHSIQTLTETQRLDQSASGSRDNSRLPNHVQNIPARVEKKIFKVRRSLGKKYQEDVVSRVLNLNNNPEVWQNVASGIIAPEKSAVISAMEMKKEPGASEGEKQKMESSECVLEFEADIRIMEAQENSERQRGVLEYSGGSFTAYHYLDGNKIPVHAFTTADIEPIDRKLIGGKSYIITLKGAVKQIGTQIVLSKLDSEEKLRLHELLLKEVGENPHIRPSSNKSEYSATKAHGSAHRGEHHNQVSLFRMEFRCPNCKELNEPTPNFVKCDHCRHRWDD